MTNFETLDAEELVTVAGGQLNTIPGAYRPNSGMQVPIPSGTASSNWDRSAAPGEAAAQRPNPAAGGGGGGGGVPQFLPLLY